MSKKSTYSVQSGGCRPDYKLIKADSKTFKKDFDSAMYYVHYEYADKKLKAETIKYAKTRQLNYRVLELVDNYYFAIVGKVCLIKNHSGDVPSNWNDFVTTTVVELIAKGEEIEKQKNEEAKLLAKVSTPVVVNIQDRIKERAAEVAGEFEGYVDEFMLDPASFDVKKYDPLAIMKLADLKAAHARYIIKFYQSEIDELELVISGKDAELKESYQYTKPQLKKLLELYKKLIQAAKMLIESGKVNRKLPKRKAVPLEKVTSKLKYLKECKENGLVSISPTEIVGALELWVYNTKSRKLGKYIAIDQAGLGIKSTTILNFSEKSVEKTLRKPKEQLKAFKSAGKVALRTFLEEIGTLDTSLKSRLNENHILLKVVK